MYKTRVFWATYSEIPSGWYIRPHSHDFFHLVYVKSGQLVYLANGNLYNLSKGNLILFPPGVVHETPKNAHTLSTIYEVKFYILDEELLKLCSSPRAFLFSNALQFEHMLQYISHHWSLNGIHIADSIDSFLSAILHSMHITEDDVAHSVYIDTADYSVLTKKIISYIENNYMEPYRLEQLAATLEYNKNYICTAFRRDTGITIVDYLTFVRIRKVLRFLYNLDFDSDTKINMISQYVGYQNSSHFNRVFKSMTGLTPSQYVSAIVSRDPGRNPTKLAKYYEEKLGIHILPLSQSLKYMRGLKDAIGDDQQTPPNQG